jgi:hypothetical protein
MTSTARTATLVTLTLLAAVTPWGARVASAGTLFPSDELAFLEPWQRANAVIELEPAGGGSAALVAELERVDELWNQGRHEQALARLRSAEGSGAELGLAISWRDPLPAPKLHGVTVSTHADTSHYALDSHAGTGHLFVVAKDPEPSGERWRVHTSTDHGATWTETASYLGTAIPDSNAVVLGDYLYVAYVNSAATEVRTRRCAVSTGAMDPGYSYKTALTTTGAFEEAAVVSNADWADTRLRLVAIEASGVLRYAWADEEGDPWTEADTGVTDADHSLAACANQDSAGSGNFVFAIYASSGGSVSVWRRGSAGQAADDLATYLGSTVSVAAWNDHVAVAYLGGSSASPKVYVRFSADGASSWPWSVWRLVEVDDPRPDVTLRKGAGMALTHQNPASIDRVLFLRHVALGGSSESFDHGYRCNEANLHLGAESVVERLPEGGWGVLTKSDADLTLRFDLAPLLSSVGFDTGDTTGWSSVSP